MMELFNRRGELQEFKLSRNLSNVNWLDSRNIDKLIDAVNNENISWAGAVSVAHHAEQEIERLAGKLTMKSAADHLKHVDNMKMLENLVVKTSQLIEEVNARSAII